jgi:hypothetical protein
MKKQTKTILWIAALGTGAFVLWRFRKRGPSAPQTTYRYKKVDHGKMGTTYECCKQEPDKAKEEWVPLDECGTHIGPISALEAAGKIRTVKPSESCLERRL